jgi:hypothetical protein
MDTKHWSESKTIVINAVVLGLAAAESKLDFLQPLLPVNVYAVFAFALPVINTVLRTLTTTGVRL